MTGKVEVKLRLPKDKKELIKQRAKEEKRSINNLLEIIIDEYLKNTK